MLRQLRRVLCALGLAVAVASVGVGAVAAGEQAGASALESRLYSPCCFGGTLDVHDSDLARNLRKEIEFRLAHGEAAEGIQRDFVARYGERVVAARSDVAIRTMSLVLVGLMAAVGAAVGFTVLGWVRRGARGRPDILGEPADRDALDERLDAELAEIE